MRASLQTALRMALMAASIGCAAPGEVGLMSQVLTLVNQPAGTVLGLLSPWLEERPALTVVLEERGNRLIVSGHPDDVAALIGQVGDLDVAGR